MTTEILSGLLSGAFISGLGFWLGWHFGWFRGYGEGRRHANELHDIFWAKFIEDSKQILLEKEE